jgi:hypothetical protein
MDDDPLFKRAEEAIIAAQRPVQQSRENVLEARQRKLEWKKRGSQDRSLDWFTEKHA